MHDPVSSACSSEPVRAVLRKTVVTLSNYSRQRAQKTTHEALSFSFLRPGAIVRVKKVRILEYKINWKCPTWLSFNVQRHFVMVTK